MQGSFALAAFKKKNQEQKRKVAFRQTSMRYVVLVIACLVVFGCQYCFDNPSALQTQIQHNYQQDHHGQEMGQTSFNLLYSLYSFPNVIIPLIGGILIDKIGARIVLIITAVFCVLGQIVFGFGGLANSFAVMLVGRVIFGIGGQVLHASQNTIISNWFKASELSMALGVCISFPKLGSSLNSILSPTIAGKVKQNGYWNVALPIFVGLGIMIGSLILSIILALIDRKSDKDQTVLHQSDVLSKRKDTISTPKKSVKSVRLVDEEHYQDTQKETGQHIKLSDIKELPLTFWLLILISMLSQALFIPFLDNGNYYYQKVFKNIETPDEAGMYLILPYVISSILVPIMGYFVDKVGRRSDVLIASVAFFILTYGFMLSVQTNVVLRQSQFARWIPTFLLGVCVAIFCTVIVPTVPMLVKPKLLGTGFGIMEMIQNLGLACFPLIAGMIRQTQQESKLKGFHLQTLFFFIVSCFCLCLAIYLKTADILSGSKMQVRDFRATYVKSIMKQE